jgi:hypothetical protein
MHPASVLGPRVFVLEDTGDQPAQVLGNDQPDKVRVTLADGSQEVLHSPTVSGDPPTGVSENGEPVSIPLTSVSAL